MNGRQDSYAPPRLRQISDVRPGSVAGKSGTTDRLNVSLDDILRYLPFVDDYRSIYYSGSFALGWNHSLSDLDLFVVTAAPVAIDSTLGDKWTVNVGADPPAVHFFLGVLGPFRSDVEFWLERQVDHVLARLPRGGDIQSSFDFPEADRDFLHKLQVGKALGGEQWLAERQRQLVDSQLGTHLALKDLSKAYSTLEDAEGLLLAGDEPSALLATQHSFHLTVDAVLTSSGDLTHQPKWRARRCREVADELMPYDRYWAIETMADYRPERAAQWIAETTQFCHGVLIRLAERIDAQL